MTEFYKNYCKLCDEIGLTPSGAAIKMGLNKGTVSVWKNKGVIPAGKTLQTLSAFFCVSTERLLPGEQKTPPAEAEGEGASDFSKQFFAAYGKQNEEFTEEQVRDIAKFAKWVKAQKEGE